MGETNAVRAKVADYLSAQVCENSSISAGNSRADVTALGSMVTLHCGRTKITKAILRELKQQVILQEVDAWKRKISLGNSGMGDYHELRAAVGQLCAAYKRSDTRSVLKLCIELTEDVILLHEREQRILSSGGDSSSTHQKLFHASELCALVIEALELSASAFMKGNSVTHNKSSKVPHRSKESVMAAVQRALGAVEEFAALLAMGSPDMQSMQSIIHSKRGSVYSVLSQFYTNTEQNQRALEAEQSAITELSSALQRTRESDGEFPGLVVEYVRSAIRLAKCFQRVGMVPEAVEWADVAVSNALVRFEDSANEMRLRAAELSDALRLRAGLAGQQGDVVKQADFTKAIESVSARFVFG
jgi:hypothetical protein